MVIKFFRVDAGKIGQKSDVVKANPLGVPEVSSSPANGITHHGYLGHLRLIAVGRFGGVDTGTRELTKGEARR